MSKFGKKLIIWIMLIVIGLGGVSILINTQFIERYYLSIKKNELERGFKQLENLQGEALQQAKEQLNQEDKLFIITIPWHQNLGKLNDSLRSELEREGINVKRMWVWEGALERLQKGEVVNQIYNQQKLKYSILMKYVKIDNELLAMMNIIPHTMDVIRIVNIFSVGIWITSLLLMMFLIRFFIKRFTSPLVNMKELADDISHLNFKTITVSSNDELGELAESINRMSEKLEYSHQKLENKNKYMKQLLSDAAHELKTPIALIKAYSVGVQDGIDDGTFLETIIQQNDVMDRTVNKLLDLCRIEQREGKLERVNISELIKRVVRENSIYLNQETIHLDLQVQESLYSMIDEDAVLSVVTNFVTNAIKYTQDERITIQLMRQKNSIYFEIRNGVSETMKEHLAYIWRPFYVGETSRNKAMCGTGLGLYIVQQILEKYGIQHGCHLEGTSICFFMYLEECL